MTLKNKISQHDYEFLVYLSNKYTFDSKSENLNFFVDNRLTKQELARVDSIMKESIKDYIRFRFFLDKIYFDYKWDESFIGIGSIHLHELLNGFDPYTKKEYLLNKELSLLSEDELKKYKEMYDE